MLTQGSNEKIHLNLYARKTELTELDRINHPLPQMSAVDRNP